MRLFFGIHLQTISNIHKKCRKQNKYVAKLFRESWLNDDFT